ncbi:MAG: SBBP repeat-containing protein [Candidatus Zixiibacteriota bacterium]
MVKKLFVSVLLFFVSAPVFARVDTAWVRRYNGPGDDFDVAAAIAVDGSGNVFVTGYRTSSATLADYTTIKYGPDGDSLWVRQYDGPGALWDAANAMVVDTSGNVYVTGYSGDIYGANDYATLKYDSLGDCRFLRRYDGPANGQDLAQAMAIDDSGYVYVTGYSQGDGTDYDYATIKYLSNGVVAWVARYNGPGNGSDWANDIVVDGSGFIYVTGQSQGIGSGIDYATAKYYPHGDTAWVRRYNGPGNRGDRATAIAVDGLGNVYVTGESYGDATDNDFLTIKYLPNGDTAWTRRLDGPGGGPDEANAVATDAFGYVYVTGGLLTSPT